MWQSNRSVSDNVETIKSAAKKAKAAPRKTAATKAGPRRSQLGRSRGAASWITHPLSIRECEEKKLPLRLQVLRSNPALRLYERLGFVRTAEDQIYIQMEKRPE